MKKILLVEDDKADQIAFERLVRGDGLPYEFDIVESVSAARRILENHQFDIILVDYHLEEGTAFDIFDDFKAAQAPVIFITGRGDEEIAVRAMKLGAYDYLIKDKDRHYLKILPLTVETTLERKQTHDQVRVLSHAVMSSNDGIFITDTAGRLSFVNQAFCTMYGYKQEEIIDKDYHIVLEQNQNTTTLPRQTSKTAEITHIRKDGSTFPVSISRSIIKTETNQQIAVVFVVRDITERKKIEREREQLINELQASLATIKQLKGMLPICASCKKIRDDQGYWQQVEEYLSQHAEVEFSHGFCPDCLKKLYPEYYEE